LFHSIPPVLGTITAPQSITVAESQLAGFRCIASNFSSPYQVTWYVNSIEVSPAAERVHVVPETGTLFVRGVIGSDAGSYRCAVSNAAGTMESEAAQLSVVRVTQLGEAVL